MVVVATLVALVLAALVVVVTALVALVLATLVVVVAALVLVVVTTLVVVVVAGVVVVASDGELVAVVLSATLGDGHDDGLVVGGGEHGADTVVAGGETACDGGGEQAVAVAGVVDSLEEDEAGGIEGLVGGQVAAHVLDCDVSVADDVTLAVKVLGRSVVGALGIGEGAGGKVVDLNLDVEVLIGFDVVVVGGVDEDGGDHAVLGGDLAHGDTVAAASGLLLAVCQLLALAEVDEVLGVTGERLVRRMGRSWVSGHTWRRRQRHPEGFRAGWSLLGPGWR